MKKRSQNKLDSKEILFKQNSPSDPVNVFKEEIKSYNKRVEEKAELENQQINN